MSSKVSLLAGLSSDYKDVVNYEDMVDMGAIPDAASPDGESADGDAADEQGGEGDDASGGPMTEGAEGADGAGGPDGGASEPGSQPDAGNADSGGGEENSSAPGSGGDLARPDNTKKLVSVYNYGSGVYEVYDVNDLLTASETPPVATLDMADSAQAKLIEELKAEGRSQPLNRGAIIMIAAFAAIAILLIYLQIRRRRLTRYM
jgi:hypothetical protein